MPLTTAQIAFLRFARSEPILVDQKIHPDLPLNGAAAWAVYHSLRKRGYVDLSGQITSAGQGALLRSPQASSEFAQGEA